MDWKNYFIFLTNSRLKLFVKENLGQVFEGGSMVNNGGLISFIYIDELMLMDVSIIKFDLNLLNRFKTDSNTFEYSLES